MILDAAWTPTTERIFATAGRDKEVKIWGMDDEGVDFSLRASIKEENAVTAVDFTIVVMGDGKVSVLLLLGL